MTGARAYKLFVGLSLLMVVLSLVWIAYATFANRPPGDMAFQAGNTYFSDQRYLKAKQSYLAALQANPNFAPAYGGLANTMVQLKDFPEALRFIDEAIEIDPKFGGFYATRGIVHDHMGSYQKAIADYEKAVMLYPEVSDGMGWFDRFFYKLPEAPPTVADRLAYLKEQMKLPQHKRVLRLPDIDAQQKPYDQ